MFDMLQEQPKDIEKLTEISEFLVTLTEKSDELQHFRASRLVFLVACARSF